MVSYTRLPGGGFYVPDSPLSIEPQLGTMGVIDATGEKISIVGRVRWKDNAATKNIRRLQFKFGTIVKAGGSALTVSLQDVSLTAGPAYQPDGVQDQTVAVANADAGFASSTWYRTNALSADRAASYGSLLAVVVEFDGAGRLGADVVRLMGNTSSSSLFAGGSAQYTSSWASSSLPGIPVVLLEADDGTLGVLDYSLPFTSAANGSQFGNASTPDECGIAFTLNFNCKIDTLWMFMNTAANTSDFDICLYRGTTLLASVSNDANVIASIGSLRFCTALIDEVEIQKNVEHFITLKPTTTGLVRLYEIDVNDASHWDFWPGGQAWCFASRADAGAFSKTATKRVLAGFRASHIGVGPSPTLGIGV